MKFGFPRGLDRPHRPLKKVCNDYRDGKGICCWRSVNDDHTEDDAKNNDIRDRGMTTADNGADGGNSKEDRVDDNNGGGDD